MSMYVCIYIFVYVYVNVYVYVYVYKHVLKKKNLVRRASGKDSSVAVVRARTDLISVLGALFLLLSLQVLGK